MGHKNNAQCKFYVYVSTDATADATSCSIFASFILTLEKSEPKIWMRIKHCLNRAKAIAIQETQNMHCVDAAASDAENLCKWCLASFVDIVWEFLFQNILNDSARSLQYICHTGFIWSINRRKWISYSCHRNLLQIVNVDQELALLVVELTTLRRKIIQRSIFGDNDLFSSSGCLHV